MGASITKFSSCTNAPSIDYLNGDSYLFGCSSGVPIEGVPIVACTDFVVIPTKMENKYYYGNTSAVGIGTPGIEAHAGSSYTLTWESTKFNVFDIAEDIDKSIEEW